MPSRFRFSAARAWRSRSKPSRRRRGHSRLCVRGCRISEQLHWWYHVLLAPRRVVHSDSKDASEFRALYPVKLYVLRFPSGVNCGVEVVSAVKYQGRSGPCWTSSATQAVDHTWCPLPVDTRGSLALRGLAPKSCRALHAGAGPGAAARQLAQNLAHSCWWHPHS